ncbi:hypothetical protein ACFSTE_17240 [Aquimarina hainanensis]|uniref:Peptidase M48 domain-containing protein n=1 Tax=Aquimarina hainanensis TaxID=1578017 RepID=A0ABW5NAX4_9FLAO|nr:hypothetical protein [Aquimarina sp. TRL1]QKX06916.1 hypothetical protein HN014_18995 [Aquimarina sp. TRL1]
MEVIYIISIVAFVIIILYNLFVTSANLFSIISFCFKINSVAHYWSDVKKANVHARSIYSTIIGLVIALIAYLIISPVIFFRKYLFSTKSGTDYFSNVQKDKILLFVQHLKESLPKATQYNYQIPLDKLLEGIPPNTTLNQQLQLIADKMCVHLLLDKPIKVMTINTVDAGKFEHINGMNCIFINGDQSKHNIHQKYAILAHEITHYYLEHHNIRMANTNENEFLTEICAVYVGFGFIMLDGYDYVKTADQYNKVGYVDAKVLLEAIIQVAYVRRQNPFHIVKNLGIPTRFIARIKLKALIQEYKAFQKKKQ